MIDEMDEMMNEITDENMISDSEQVLEEEEPKKKKGKKESVPMSVITLPLKTEIWQADRLDKMFEACRSIYNAMLGYELKKYRRMTADPRYKEVQEKIAVFYADSDKEVRKSPECRAALNEKNVLHKEYGFYKFAFTNDITDFYKHFDSISSEMACLSVAIPMWTAFEKLLYGNGKMVHYKKRGTMNSIATSGKSGLRILNSEGKRLTCGSSYEQMYLVSKFNKKKMLMPIVLPAHDRFKHDMMERPIKIVRLTRKLVNGIYKYYVQLTVIGNPALKLNKDGEKKHMPGTGAVGIYIDTRTVTAATPDGKIHSFELNKGIFINNLKKDQLNSYLSASRLHNNPDNFEADGTIKKGRVVDGQRLPLEWHVSNRYKQARNERSDVCRVEAEQRLLERNRLANELLALGDRFVINDYPFALAAERKKRDELTKAGTPKSKAMAGKAIGENAPSMLITLLQNKLASHNMRPVDLIKIEKIERKGNYRENYAKQMLSVALTD